MRHPKFEKAIKRIFNIVGLKAEKYDRSWPDLWSNIGEFKELFKQIESRTVVSQDRCFMLYQWAQYAARLEGEMAEVGVYKGGTAKLIAKTCPQKTVHLFDTFSGMPEVESGTDVHRKGDFADTSLESVKKFLGDCGNVVFHPGFFPDTAGPVRDVKFSFVYADMDIYQSTKSFLEFFYPRMVCGGVMMFDDYEWRGCPGVKKAISEFLADKNEIPIITARYQCMLLKG